MYAVAVNLKTPRSWRLKVQDFISKLEEAFGSRLIAVVALPSPEDLLYDSNVLIVLDKLKEGDLEKTAAITPDEISPLVVPEEDKDAVEAFLSYKEDTPDENSWLTKLKKFTKLLKATFGSRLIAVVALPSPEDLLYDSNVLIVLDKLKEGDLEKTAALAPDSINPLVVPEEDKDAVEAFQLRGGVKVE